jgi:hypothetical protein
VRKTGLWFLVLLIGFAMMLVSCWWQRPAHPSASSAASATADRARVAPGPFCLYLGGMALLLGGGSALLMRLYGSLLAGRAAWSFGSPLVAMCRHRRLLCALHLAYFGALILFAAVAYAAPEVQHELLRALGREIQSGRGPLGVAAKAYLSRNVVLAALVTLAVNFLLGSLLSITLPSIVLPGAGLLIALLRTVIWGLVLSPSSVAVSRAMLPHSFTVLLEGEAYILASFFAVLVPVYLFRRGEGLTASRRYGRALLLNLKGNLPVLIVLSVAAAYEAVEVIWMMGWRR